MEIHAILPPKGRDLRLDVFRGVANWAIFVDHIPDNAVNWITTRNYGFSDAADLFVFISGYTAAFVYANMMLNRGVVIGATRLFKRVWQLYVAHIVLLFIYITAVGVVAHFFKDPELLNEFNVTGFLESPFQMMAHGLLLSFKPLNLDVLPLYIVLMAVFPLVLWLMLYRPDLTMVGSIILYLAARHYQWNLAGFPMGGWYFNPFTWQVLFVFGAWFALGGARESGWVINSKWLPIVGVAYLLFAMVVTLGNNFPTIGAFVPNAILSEFPNDKTYMPPYRVLHFVVIAFLVTRFVPRDWPGFESKFFEPLIKCGQQSLAVFCVGIFLSFVADFLLKISYGSLWAQIAVSVAGIFILCCVAYYISWSKRMDKPSAKPKPSPDVPSAVVTDAPAIPVEPTTSA